MPWLSLSIRLHQGRFHGLDSSGRSEWPPAPARVFQALVAGAANAHGLGPEERNVLGWLERLDPPLIGAPPMRKGQYFRQFVPNNDLDTVGGDSRRIAKIRTATKVFHPCIFDPEVPFLYVWYFEDGPDCAEGMRHIAERLYQLGRGVDMASATTEVLDTEELEGRLASYPGVVYRSNLNGSGLLACPVGGSLASLIERQAKTRARFIAATDPVPTSKAPSRRRIASHTFSQPPRARFAMRPYNSPPRHLLYELRTSTAQARFAVQPLTGTSLLAERVRDAVEKKMAAALPEKADAIARVFIGRNATDADKAARIRIIPLPSIGHSQADHAIRRLLVEVPPDCPFASGDVAWAFSAVEAVDPKTGDVWNLVQAEECGMLDHYGIDQGGHCVWRTVTPVALPGEAARRRIAPARRNDPRERKNATERLDEEDSAVAAVRQALRHVHASTAIKAIRVQREPFESKGVRAELFAPGTRFVKERLWHVEVSFATPISGPLVIGDGRYLGLGLMAPASTPTSIHVFTTHTAVSPGDVGHLARALRRAVMARVRDRLRLRSDEGLPLFFCGHEPGGAPAGPGGHEHLFFAIEPGSSARFLIVAPHRVTGRAPTYKEIEHLRTLEEALDGFVRLLAGRVGAYDLSSMDAILSDDPVLGSARTWESRIAYCPTRHASRGKDASDAVVRDVTVECERRGLPRPDVELLELAAGPNGGNLLAHMRLRFAVAVDGPIILGRDSHMGGGLFAAVDDRSLGPNH